MTEDFDLVGRTFESIHKAMEDIEQLDARAQRKLPGQKEDTFARRLMAIFIALLDFCSFSAHVFEVSRKREFLNK